MALVRVQLALTYSGYAPGLTLFYGLYVFTHALTHTAPTDLTVAAALVRKAYSKRRRLRLWSKPVNLRTCAHVSDSIVMVQAFAELRYGVVVHTRENSVKYGHNLGPNPSSKLRRWFIVHSFNKKTLFAKEKTWSRGRATRI